MFWIHLFVYQDPNTEPEVEQGFHNFDEECSKLFRCKELLEVVSSLTLEMIHEAGLNPLGDVPGGFLTAVGSLFTSPHGFFESVVW